MNPSQLKKALALLVAPALSTMMGFSAAASDFERETGGRRIPVTTLYTCVSENDLVNPPDVSIVINAAGEMYVRTTSPSGNTSDTFVSLKSSHRSGSFYLGTRVSVEVSNDETAAVVTLDGELSYSCTHFGYNGG
jgi:hypothetical protein